MRRNYVRSWKKGQPLRISGPLARIMRRVEEMARKRNGQGDGKGPLPEDLNPEIDKETADMPVYNPEQAPKQEQPPEQQPNRPIQEFRLGRIKAAVWKNETQLGTRYSVSIVRLFKDEGDAHWRSTTSFNRDDLPLVAKVADMAHTYVFSGQMTAHPDHVTSHLTGSIGMLNSMLR